MQTSYICPSCQGKIAVENGYPGVVLSCPSCGKPFQLPGLTPNLALRACGIARWACALLAFFGSVVGLHKFAMGRWGWGIAYLVLAGLGPVTCFISTLLVGAVGVIEGAIYLCISNMQFFESYVVGKRGIF